MSYNRSVQIWVVALSALFSVSYSPADAKQPKQIPSSAVACYFVGRVFLNANGQGQAVGYFTDINGIGTSSSLFNGNPSEQTAFFTFRSNVFSQTPLPPNGDMALFLVSEGSFNIYLNRTPNGDWSNPDTFSGDQPFAISQPVARFMRPESLVLQALQTDTTTPPPFESLTLHIVTGTLASSQSFTFKGQRYDFGVLAPAGLTLYETSSNTGVAGIAGFPIGLALAGPCLAVADENMR